jgi:hypothetical protein
MFASWPWTSFETLVLVMLFVMTYILWRVDTYLAVGLKEHLENLSWVRAHLANLEHWDEHYHPKMFDMQMQILETIGHSKNILEDILVNTLPPKQRAEWKEDERIADSFRDRP